MPADRIAAIRFITADKCHFHLLPPGRLREKGGQAYPLNGRVESFDFSGHATREALVDYARRLAPKKVLLVHGDPEAMEWMRGAISTALPEAEVLIPHPGKPCRLD